MRISDWSSDVCSSDLLADGIDQRLDRTGFVDVEPASMAAGRSQALADRGRDRVAGRGADDGRAPGGEFVGDRSANPAAGDGDQRNLTQEPLFHHDSSKPMLHRMTTDKGDYSTNNKNDISVDISVLPWQHIIYSLKALNT